MKTTLDDLIKNISEFSDEHLYALLGGSLETSKVAPQGGHVLVKRGKEFFRLFLKKFRGAICEKGGLRDQVSKIVSKQTKTDLVPVITAWILARGASLGPEVTQVVAIYLAILLSRVTLDVYCDGFKQAK
jgi:hypothetical protein